MLNKMCVPGYNFKMRIVNNMRITGIVIFLTITVILFSGLMLMENQGHNLRTLKLMVATVFIFFCELLSIQI